MSIYNNDGEELALFAINDGRLYSEAMRGIIPNLAKKWRDGRYDKKLAVVLWEYHAGTAAGRYKTQIDSSARFNRASLTVAAQALERKYREAVQEMALGGGRDRRRSSRTSARRRSRARRR